jgi:LAO/AO transport system kinase
VKALADRVLSGDPGAAARACRIVDERAKGHAELLSALFTSSEKAHIIGITGAPGVGKSTLTDALLVELRARGDRVGVVAIDPTSPFSGGALLGDRIRMQRHAADPDVFVRSLATRGARGGLSRSTLDVVRVLAAWGAQTILVETVGVGQAELDLLFLADTIALVVMPGAGDGIQAQKAGILEIADVIVLNKSDRPGADAAEAELSLSLTLPTARTPSPVHGAHSGALQTSANTAVGVWMPSVVRTVAPSGEGTRELLELLARHRAWLLGTDVGKARRSARTRAGLLTFFRDVIADRVLDASQDRVERLADEVAERRLDPYAAAELLLREFTERSS